MRPAPIRLTAAVVLSSLLLSGSAIAARARFSITTKNTEMKRIGLSLRMMYKGEEQSLSPAPVYTYKNNRSGELVNMFDPYDLWYRDQYVCRWVDRFSNSCVLAEITAPLPGPFMRKHITKEEYDAGFERHTDASYWRASVLISWVENFSGRKVASDPRKLRHKPNIKAVVELDFKGPVLGYLFCMPESMHFKSEERWFYVEFGLNPEIKKDKARDEIHREFISSLRPVVTTGQDSTGHAARFQDKKFANDGEKTDAFKASRERVIKSIKNTENWWYVETRNYIIVANMKSSKRRLVNRMQSDIEYLRAAYEQFIPPMKPIEAVSVIRTFSEPAEYLDYVGPRLKWSGGVWMPQRMELVIKPLERGRAGSMDRVLSVMYHEAFHQYIHYAFNQCAPSAWFNEGHATFFQNAVISENRLRVDEDERYVGRVAELARSGGHDIKRMLKMSYPEFYIVSGTEQQRLQNYAVAWSLVYFLRKAAPLMHSNPYEYVLAKYGKSLWETKNAAAATDKAFENIDMDRFQKDYVEFWKSSSNRSKARRNQVFKEFRGWNN